MTTITHAQSNFYKTKVLVTGGCGFIGSHLVDALVTGEAVVTVIDNFQAGKLDNLKAITNRICVMEADIRDEVVVKQIVDEVRPRYVFHLAANASVPASVDDPVYDFEANCVGTFVLLNALRRRSECERVVVASSGAVYGEPAVYPIREEDALKPISPYGASKANAEISAGMFHKVYGLPVTIARLFNCYGPRMARFVILDFLRKLKKDPAVLEVLGSGQQIRDFTYVADTVQALLLLATKGLQGVAYNVSSGKSYSVTALAQKMIEALGLQGQTTLTYTGQSWTGDAQRWEVSIERMRKLGYEPHISIEEGLRHTIEWFSSEPLS